MFLGLFTTSLGIFFVILHSGFFPGWHWVPESPAELLSEVAIIVLLAQGVLFDNQYRIEQKLNKLLREK